MKNHKNSIPNSPDVTAILLMAGKGERFGSDVPKQFHKISGKAVYLHTLERFLYSELFSNIILVCPKEWIEEVQKQIFTYPSSSHLQVVEGGATRRESTYLGLMACPASTRFVVIHDAVRPFVSNRILKENIEKVMEHNAVDTCIPSADTIVHSLDGACIESIPRRAEYLRGQTPQSFSYELIRKAHEKAALEPECQTTDDCTLVKRLNHPIHIVCGDESNIKITTELDLFVAEQLLRLPNHSSDSLSSHETSLQGKIFAITGGNGGIGSSLKELLEEKGAKVLTLSKTSTDFAVDLSSYEDTKDVFQKIFSLYGPLDGLINSVGSFLVKPFAHLSKEEIRSLVNNNLFSVIYSCQCAKIKSGGHILNIASSSYSRGRQGYMVYSAAKAAVVNFTQGLAEEWPEYQINTLVPQRTMTSLRLRHFPFEDPRELLLPSYVAKAALSILQKQHLTGSIVEVKKEPALSF